MAENRIRPEIIINEYIDNLKSKLKINKVILFGSAAKHRFGKNSDLDIIVLSSSFKKINFIKRLELLSHARQGLCRQIPMDIIGYTPDEFDKLSRESVVLGEAKQKGKVIWP